MRRKPTRTSRNGTPLRNRKPRSREIDFTEEAYFRIEDLRTRLAHGDLKPKNVRVQYTIRETNSVVLHAVTHAQLDAELNVLFEASEQNRSTKVFSTRRRQVKAAEAWVQILTSLIPKSDQSRYVEEFRAELYDQRMLRVPLYRRTAYLCRLAMYVPLTAILLRVTPKRVKE